MTLETCRVLPSNKEHKKLHLVGIYMIIIYGRARKATDDDIMRRRKIRSLARRVAKAKDTDTQS